MADTWEQQRDDLDAARQASGYRSKQSAEAEVPSQRRNVSFFSYMPALAAALLKDVLDLMFIGSFPGLGTIITFCFSILIFFLLMLAGSGQNYTLTKKGMLLLAGTAVEGIAFGLNFLPIETITVFLIYRGDKKANKE